MKRTLTILLALLFYLNSNGQSSGFGSSEVEVMREVKRNQKTQNEMKKSKLNFFLDRDWKGGVIFSKDSSLTNNYLFRYNIYTDQIEYRSIINPSTIDVISIGSQKFVHTKFINEDSMLLSGYFELLENGNCKLLLRRNIKYSEGRDDIDAYGASSSTNIKESFYIKKGNEPAVLIDRSKEALREVLSDKEEVVNYIDKKLILYLTKKTAKDVVSYYNNVL